MITDAQHMLIVTTTARRARLYIGRRNVGRDVMLREIRPSVSRALGFRGTSYMSTAARNEMNGIMKRTIDRLFESWEWEQENAR